MAGMAGYWNWVNLVAVVLILLIVFLVGFGIYRRKPMSEEKPMSDAKLMSEEEARDCLLAHEMRENFLKYKTDPRLLKEEYRALATDYPSEDQLKERAADHLVMLEHMLAKHLANSKRKGWDCFAFDEKTLNKIAGIQNGL